MPDIYRYFGYVCIYESGIEMWFYEGLMMQKKLKSKLKTESCNR